LSEPDIHLRVERAFFLFVARTSDGRAFVEKRLTYAVRIGEAFAVDHKNGRNVIQQMLDDGLIVYRVRDPDQPEDA
jgi:hypothetical protein